MEKQQPGTWRLSQFHEPGTNGMCTEIGDFPTFRAATEAARVLANISLLKGGFTCTYLRSDERKGSAIDGFSRRVLLHPEDLEYDPHVEVVLPDGQVQWLEDIVKELDDLKSHYIATTIA